MVSCQDVNRLMTPYLDAEVERRDREAIEGHFCGCPPCARRAAAEGSARRIVMVKASILSSRAPDALRQRCAAVAARHAPVRAGWAVFGWRVVGLATASLLVVGLAATLLYGVVTHSSTLLVAELTIDHLKCFAFFEPRDVQGDPGAVANRLQADYGWRLAIPASLPQERLTLLGARRCFSTDGRVAHVLYRHGDRPVSLFMMPNTTREAARVAFGGHVARIWSHDQTTYVLLGSESDPDLQPVATYFQASLF